MDSATEGHSSLRFIRPLGDFLRTETGGGALIVAAAIIAMIWANSPAKSAYFELFATEIVVGIGNHELQLSLSSFIAEGLMAIFFLVVGLEIKRELTDGELSDRNKAVLPVIAALGGTIVPAALFVLINWGTDNLRGWAIPTATDIALAVGVLALLGSRVNPSLKLFVLALAIVDDIIAIIVIAAFYSAGVDWTALAIAAGFVLGVVALRKFRVHQHSPYVIIGIGLWLALHEAGIHATIAGVVMGLLAPTEPELSPDLIDVDELADVSSVEAVQETIAAARRSVSVVEWLELRLHPVSSYVIVPLFALASAGISISSKTIEETIDSRVAIGVVVGLVIGKPLGIVIATWVSSRRGVGKLPNGVTMSDIVGAGMIAGVGFTVALLIAELAFTDPTTQSLARLAVMIASCVAAGLGATWIIAGHRTKQPRPR